MQLFCVCSKCYVFNFSNITFIFLVLHVELMFLFLFMDFSCCDVSLVCFLGLCLMFFLVGRPCQKQVQFSNILCVSFLSVFALAFFF